MNPVYVMVNRSHDRESAKLTNGASPFAEELTPTRWSLIGRLKNLDDQESWREFFETYWRLIYNVARKAGLAHEEAEDVVQETVMSVCRNIPGFDDRPERGSFKNWLLGVTRWRITDQFRGRKHRGLAANSSPSPSSVGSSYASSNLTSEMNDAVVGTDQWEALWNAEWEQHVLDAALEKLKQQISARKFQIFYLHVINQQPVKEVSRTLRVSSGQVYLVKHRVAKVFTQLLREVEGGSSVFTGSTAVTNSLLLLSLIASEWMILWKLSFHGVA